MADTSYQAVSDVPPPHLEPPEPMVGVLSLKASQPGLWTSDPLTCLAIHLLIILGFFFGMLLFRYDNVRTLWRPPAGESSMGPSGIRVLAAAGVLTLSNSVLYLLVCAALNSYSPSDKDAQRSRALLCAFVSVVHLIIFLFLPVLILLAAIPTRLA
jgi:hypothetical protein